MIIEFSSTLAGHSQLSGSLSLRLQLMLSILQGATILSDSMVRAKSFEGNLVGSLTLTQDWVRARTYTSTLYGLSTNSIPTPYSYNWIQGYLLGSTSLSLSPARVVPFSGKFIGTSSLYLQRTTFQPAPLIQASSLSATLLKELHLLGAFKNTNRLILSEPQPLEGISHFAGYLTILKYPKCVCKNTKVLRFGQLLQKGDLGIWLRRINGCPFSPYQVTYSIYWLHNNMPIPVMMDKIAVPGEIGEYYAVGTLERGQPGSWKIVWKYQPSLGGPWHQEEQVFQVQDAIAAKPCNPKCKRGWW